VVLVDRDSVEAELVGADQRAQVPVVELVSPDLVEELVRAVRLRTRVRKIEAYERREPSVN